MTDVYKQEETHEETITQRDARLKKANETARHEEILGLIREHQIAGIIATNTTLDHSVVPEGRDQQGGIDHGLGIQHPRAYFGERDRRFRRR